MRQQKGLALKRDSIQRRQRQLATLLNAGSVVKIQRFAGRPDRGEPSPKTGESVQMPSLVALRSMSPRPSHD